MEREPTSTQTFAQLVKLPLAAVAVFEGDDKVIGANRRWHSYSASRLRPIGVAKRAMLTPMNYDKTKQIVSTPIGVESACRPTAQFANS